MTNYPYLDDGGAPVGLADQTSSRSRYTREVTPDERDRAQALLASFPAISLHEHPTRLPEPLTPDTWAWYRGASRAYHGFDGLRDSGTSAFFVNAWSFAPPESVLAFLGRARADVAHADGVFVAETVRDLDRTTGGGGNDGVALYLSLESATAFADDLAAFEMLYGFGVRMAGLCYNEGNAFGDGLAAEDRDEGLTRAGADFVRLAADLGLIVDLGHVGDRTSLDVIEQSPVPVVISHAGARRLWNTWRMKPDTVLRALAESGGVLGLSAAPNTTRSEAHPAHSIASIVDHLTYAVELMGIDHVGLGPDTMFGDHAGIHRLGRGGKGPWSTHSGRELGGLVEHVDGMENPAENFVNVAVALDRDGWSREDIVKVLGGNASRLMRAVLTN
ncbi:dipeptidase [Micromonospora sp. NPDC048830]|uniref:dipeptidase n=1 Tax=Micromonospora sp. NPDC048830 TaxID=3364257 RepID=UPI0037117C99